jgi:putative redox protein
MLVLQVPPRALCAIGPRCRDGVSLGPALEEITRMSDGMLIARASATLQAPPYAVAIAAGHHALTADEPKSIGGGDSGPSPFALVASGLGACTAITLRMYAERKQWTLRGLTVELKVLKAADESLRIERSVALEGDLSAEQRARLAEIAEKTPVTKALRSGFAIHTSFR